MLFALASLLAFQEQPTLKDRLKDPAESWKVFQEFVRAGEYGKAHELLSPAARKSIPVEALTLTLGAFEASRRLIAALQVHAVDPAAGRLRLCGPEFGVGRDFKIAGFHGITVLDFTRDDIEFFKGRTLGWRRHQVKRADGWQFAYPPDWSYAPVARACICGK
jgi:hypothetical protein